MNRPAPIRGRDGKRFGRHIALDGLSLSVARGEVVCLIGPSGREVHFLRCLNAQRLHAGRIVFDGGGGPARTAGRAHDPPPHGHGVPELRAVPAPLRAAQRRDRRAWCSGSGRRGGGARDRSAGQGRPRRSRREASGAALGGQQQRVAIARALAMRSPISCCSTSRPRRSTRRPSARC